MHETVYLHRDPNSCLGVLFTEKTAVIHTGLEVQIEKEAPLLEEVSRLCGLDFFTAEPDIPLYGVPCLWLLAGDGRGGWLAGTEGREDGPVYHIGPDRSVHLITKHYGALFDWMANDPDWRQKHLPGGPWPRLPEDREGRKQLAEALRLPAPPSKEKKAPGPLPRVFASREDAERAFPIQDLWTLLRQNREPRFQVHPMMSPADREGRAFVHYTAWREAYAGLMDERILAAHTMEHCRKMAGMGGPDDTFVALDRENNDRVAGFACFSRRARALASAPGAGEITALYVLREYQGLGLGRMLLESCLSRLPGTDLFVVKGNEKAIGFYEHMGFRLTGRVLDNETDSGARIRELEMVRYGG